MEAVLKMSVRIRIRRDTTANWVAVNPIIEDGEFALDINTRQTKLGDGVRTWLALPDFAGGAVSSLDSEWVLAQTFSGSASEVDSDWVLRQVSNTPLDSEWILNQITNTPLDSEWILNQITNTPLDSEWILNQITNTSLDSEWVLRQAVDSEYLKVWVDDAISNIIDSDYVLSVVADSEWVLRRILEGNGKNDSEWIMRQINIGDSKTDSDWILRQINIGDSKTDSEWIFRQIADTSNSELDSDWVMSHISKTDSEWIFRQIADTSNSELDSDWVMSHISKTDSEWIFRQIADTSNSPIDSEWILRHVAKTDSDWVLRQIPSLKTFGTNLIVGDGFPDFNGDSDVLYSGNTSFGIGIAQASMNSQVDSTYVGYNAGAVNTSFGRNTFIGAKSGIESNAQGTTLIGYEAGKTAEGWGNVIVGYVSGADLSGNTNIVIGTYAGFRCVGNDNILIGKSVNTSDGLSGNSGQIIIGGPATTRFAVPGIGLDTDLAEEGSTLRWKNGGFDWDSDQYLGGIQRTPIEINAPLIELYTPTVGGFLDFSATDNTKKNIQFMNEPSGGFHIQYELLTVAAGGMQLNGVHTIQVIINSNAFTQGITNFYVDNQIATVLWPDGFVPATRANTMNVYTFTIIRTSVNDGPASVKVLGQLSKFL